MARSTKMPLPEGPGNAVSLFTIHHAKGLERAVCFLCSAKNEFNRQDLQKNILIDQKLGCGTMVPQIGVFSMSSTIGYNALTEHLSQQLLEEEMRVLYVALTRASERLYITSKITAATKARIEKNLKNATTPITSRFAIEGKSFLDWILLALQPDDYSEFCKITTYTKTTLDAFIKMVMTSKKLSTLIILQ